MKLIHGCTVVLEDGREVVINYHWALPAPEGVDLRGGDPYCFYFVDNNGENNWYDEDGEEEYSEYPKIVKVLSTSPTVTDRQKTASDGGSTSYYDLPSHAEDIGDLISHIGMSFARGNLFKACYRLGQKEGVDVMYDLNKMEYFVAELKKAHKRGELL